MTASGSRAAGGRDSCLLLYDPATGGHHEDYVRITAEVLGKRFGISTVSAVPPAARLPESDFLERFDIAPSAASSVRRSVSELMRAIETVKPAAVLHMFADRDLMTLAAGRRLGVPCCLLLFRPRSHYTKVFGDRLHPRETVIGLAIEWSLRLWMARSKSNSVMSLDQFAVAEWRRRSGSRATWWPEPPSVSVESTADAVSKDVDVLLFGSIAERKGVGALCDALQVTERVRSVKFAGPINENYAAQLDRAVGRLERRGIEIRVENNWITDAEVPNLLAGARVSAIPYPRHFGMSRVLLEAAAAGIPVVGNEFGLIGRLINDHQLGMAVNTNDPHEFALALDQSLGPVSNSDADRQSAFVANYGRTAFIDAMRSVVRMVESPGYRH